MQLPGGIALGGELKRDYQFRPVTGAFELALRESALCTQSHAERVTAVLSQTLARIAHAEVHPDMVRNLSVGDRQFLMRQLAIHIDDGLIWLNATCGQCKETFDVSFRQSDLPVKAANDKFPETKLNTSLGHIFVRVPTGADQEAIARIDDEQHALMELLQRIVRTTDQANIDPTQFSNDDIQCIEAIAEEMAPEIAEQLLAQCPHCKTNNRVTVSPYSSLQAPLGELFAEIHSLATHYHWSEAEILALPRERRQTYLQLIDRSRGMRSTAYVGEQA